MVATNAIGERAPHVQPRLVDRNPVEHRIGTRKVYILEETGRQPRRSRALPRMKGGISLDHDRLAGQHVAPQLIAQGIDRDTLGGDDVFGRTRFGIASDHQRPDAKGVTKGNHAEAGDHRHHRIGPAAAPMDLRHCGKNGLGIDPVPMCSEFEFMREHIEQDLGVGVRVDMPQIVLDHLGFQLLAVGEVAVMPEHDAERRVDVKRLRLGTVERRPGCWITAVRNPHAPGQRTHVPGPEHVAHHAAAFVHVKHRTIAAHDASSVLTTVLQQQQAVIEHLVDRGIRDDTNDTTHQKTPWRNQDTLRISSATIA